MKFHCTLFIVAFFFGHSLCAQYDSVTLGPGAHNMVFYRLRDGQKTTASNTDWHLAFSVRNAIIPNGTNRAACVRINGANGVKLWKVPGKDTSSFATLDTTGFRTWPRYHDGDTSLNLGAFNTNKNFNFDFNYGWGEYVIAGNVHSVLGDSLYLLQLPDGSFKKLSLLSLWKDTAWYFQFANLDNSGFTLQRIGKKPYKNKNFVYFNLQTAVVMDKEPNTADWDLLFLRYTTTEHDPQNLLHEMGILQNEYVSAAMVTDSNYRNTCYTGKYDKASNVIGKNYRSGGTSDTLVGNRAFYIKTPAGQQYRLQVKRFEGPQSGYFYFEKEQCFATGIHAETENNLSLQAFPNPAHEKFTVVFEAVANEKYTLVVTDLLGREIARQQVTASQGTNIIEVPTYNMNSGNYLLRVMKVNDAVVLRITKE